MVELALPKNSQMTRRQGLAEAGGCEEHPRIPRLPLEPG